MARYQYRYAGSFDWMSNSGNALVVISNPAGSGKKLTIRSSEVTNKSALVATVANYTLYRSTVAGGEEQFPSPLDSTATWPSTVHILTSAASTSPGISLRRFNGSKNLGVGLSWFNMQTPRSFGELFRTAVGSGAGDTEGIVIRAGESIAMKADIQAAYRPTPLRVSATVVVSGTPDRTFAITYYANQSASMDDVPFALKNDSGSGEVVTLRNIAVEEVGTLDTPYLQLVPVGSINASSLTDATRLISPVKMDSNNPDPSSWVKVYKDVALLPLGMPENALSDASTGNPKNVNYLKTKDLLGPVYRVYFPENAAATGLDTMGTNTSHHYADLFGRRAGITIREGEAIALVSAAETATAATFVPMSGWMSLDFGFQIDVEPKIEPTLSITGLKVNSEIRIFDASTTTEIAGSEDIDSGTFQWVFDPTEHPSIDISIMSLGYQNIRLLAQSLTLADLTIPVQQQVDRQYGNP
jgi:hypothetical protein